MIHAIKDLINCFCIVLISVLLHVCHEVAKRNKFLEKFKNL